MVNPDRKEVTMVGKQDNASVAEQSNIVHLTDRQIMRDKARRIMAREKKKNPKVLFYPIEELVDTAVFLLKKRDQQNK
jgi:hypothetical protein